jgi:hypothetical protein
MASVNQSRTPEPKRIRQLIAEWARSAAARRSREAGMQELKLFNYLRPSSGLPIVA